MSCVPHNPSPSKVTITDDTSSNAPRKPKISSESKQLFREKYNETTPRRPLKRQFANGAVELLDDAIICNPKSVEEEDKGPNVGEEGEDLIKKIIQMTNLMMGEDSEEEDSEGAFIHNTEIEPKVDANPEDEEPNVIICNLEREGAFIHNTEIKPKVDANPEDEEPSF